MIVGDQDAYNLRYRCRRRFHDGIGTVRTMLVPWPAVVWISNFPSICEALVRMLPNPNPSLFSRLALEIPDPLSFTLRMRLGGFQRSVTFTTVGLAWRTALLIASWEIRNSSCCILVGQPSSGTPVESKLQRNLPGTTQVSVAVVEVALRFCR